MHVWFNFWNNAQWKAPNVMGYVSRNDNTFAHVSLWMVKLNAFVTSDEKKYVGCFPQSALHSAHQYARNNRGCHIFILKTRKVGEWLNFRK